jgi:AraC family transcriptional regulator
VKADTLESYHERLARVLAYIEGHLDEPLPLEDLAAVACFSPYHFHRVFRGMVGESVKEHVRRLRLERAARRLLGSDSTVLALALDAGYETPESFTRAFEARFGLAPSVFRGNGGKMNAVSKSEKAALPAVDVTVRRMQPLRVAYVRHIGPYNQVGEAWSKLMMWAGPKGVLGPNAVRLGISHDDPEITPPERLRYDAALAVPDSVTGSGEVAIQEIGGGEYAVAIHRGPYDRLNQTYAALCGQWLPASGREARNAPPLEFYRTSFGQAPPEEFVTEIYLPLA